MDEELVDKVIDAMRSIFNNVSKETHFNLTSDLRDSIEKICFVKVSQGLRVKSTATLAIFNT
jgi:hypothetical protein